MSILRKQSHFYSAIASFILAIGEILLTAWALKTTEAGWSFQPDSMNITGILLFSIAVAITAIGLLSSIAFGIWQIIQDGNSERGYAGWFSIFIPYFIFTIFVNFTMWRRSGLTKLQFEDGVKKFNIEHIEKIIDIIKFEDRFPKTLIEPFAELRELRKRKLLSDYEMHSFMYKVLVQKLHHSGIPVVFEKQEIFELEVYK